MSEQTEWSNVNVQIPAQLHREAKAKAALLGLSMGEMIESALRFYLSKSAQGKAP